MSSTLGFETFATFQRPDRRGAMPNRLVEQMELLSEPGLDGVSIRKLGERGIPAAVVSKFLWERGLVQRYLAGWHRCLHSHPEPWSALR